MTHRRFIEEKTVAGRRLGRHVEHDERSRSYAVQPATTSISDLREVHHRHYRVLDQGDLGSCTGNAVVGAINTLPDHHAGEKLLDEDTAVAVYSLATRLDGIGGEYPPEDTGSSGLAACKAAKQLGLITGYRHAFGIDQALLALQDTPVITGVVWVEGFDDPDEEGLVRLAGEERGGHEFVVVGYEQHHRTVGESTVVAVNSWGETWGLRGRFRFTVADWARLLDMDGDVTVPVR